MMEPRITYSRSIGAWCCEDCYTVNVDPNDHDCGEQKATQRYRSGY